MGTETRYSHLLSDNMWCSLSKPGYSRGYRGESVCSLYRTECDWDNRIRIPDYSVLETGDRDAFDSNESAYWSDLDKYEMWLPSLPKHETYEARDATVELAILQDKLLMKDEEIDKLKQELVYERSDAKQALSILSENIKKIRDLERDKDKMQDKYIWEVDKLKRIICRQKEELNYCGNEKVKLENKLSTEKSQRLNYENETKKYIEIVEVKHMRVETELNQQIYDSGIHLNRIKEENMRILEELKIKDNKLQNKVKEYEKNQLLFHKQDTEKENFIRKLSEKNSKLEDKINLLLKDKEEIKWTRQTQEISRLERINQDLRSENGELRQKVKDLSEKLLQKKTSSATERKESMSKRQILPQIDDEKSSFKATAEMEKQLREKELEIQEIIQDKRQLMADLKIHQKKSDKLQEELGQLRGQNELLRKELMQEKETANIKENEFISLQKFMTRTEEDISVDEMQKQLSEKNTELQRKIDLLLQDKKNLAEELRYEKETEMKRKSHDISKQHDESRNLQKEVDRLRHDNQILNNKLRLEKENFHLEEQTLNRMQHNVKTQNEEISKLKAEVENERQMNFEHRINVRKLLQEKKDLTKELTKKREIGESTENCGNTTVKGVSQTLQDDVTKLRLQNQLLNDSLRQEKEKVKQIEKETKVHNSDMQKQMEIQASEILALKQKLKEISAQNSKTDSRVSKNQGLDQDLQKRHEDAMDQVRHLQKELEETKSRLSRAMGDRLTDNNPNIADLSDKNRPTKLSERFQELYDNQWTDAFEIINATFGDEGNTINALRMILMDALEYCKTQAAHQMKQIKETFLKGDEFPANMIKQVKECRKAMAEQYGKGLYREYYDQLRTSKSEKALHAIKTPSYVKECFEVCWLMAVQDPPVVFGPDTRRGDNFNKDHYRPYTRSGERVDFVVWPVLLLHQNGPVLCKGVAQGK